MNRTLSICIPTFNRGPLLIECLRSMLPELSQHVIQVCISDNGSSDDTQTLVEEFRLVYPHIAYVRHTTNRGIDRNIVSAVAMADTRYAWIFGDDDQLRPGAVTAVLERLLEEPTVVVVNRSELSRTMRRVIRERTLPLQGDVAIADPERFLSEIASYITFVGALVVDVAAWQRVDPTGYLDTDFVHVGIVQEMLAKRPRAVVIGEPFIGCRTGNATWSDRYYDVWVDRWVRTIEMLPASYGRPARDAAIHQALDGAILTLLSARAAGKYNLREYRARIRPYYRPFDWRRSVALATSVVPHTVAKAVTRWQRGIRRRMDQRRTRAEAA